MCFVFGIVGFLAGCVVGVALICIVQEHKEDK